MSQVSKRQLKKDTAGKIDLLLKESIISCDSALSAAEFLDDLLTPTEKIMVAKRLAIAFLLLKGYSYGSIKQLLKVSAPTIGSVSLSLKIKGGGYRKVLDKFARKQQWKNLFQELGDTVIDILGSGKGSNWNQTKSYLYQRKKDRESAL